MYKREVKSKNWFCSVFFYCLQNPVVCTQQIPHLGNHPRWEWGKRYSVEENGNDHFSSIQQTEEATFIGWLVISAVTVY